MELLQRAKANLLKVLIIVLFFIFNSCKQKSNPIPTPGDNLFPKVRTIVQTNCTSSCHAPAKGFFSGLPVILESDSDIVTHAKGIKSAIFDSVTVTNKRMPPDKGLSANDKDTILIWFSKGGKIK